MALALGERHNGESVVLTDDNQIYKPRSIYWEWMFLGKDSPLQKNIQSLSTGKPSPIDGFANLDFEFDNSERFSGYVQKLNTTPPAEINTLSSYKIGGVYATAAWFGMTDLHFENLIFGLDSSNTFRFCPIDIESLFEEIELFSQTQLVAAKNTRADLSGSYSLVKYGPNISAICSSFLSGIDFYHHHQKDIDESIQGANGFSIAPIRIVVRPTGEYVKYLNSGTLPDYPFFEEEMIQLEYGDVPYFFRRVCDDFISYYGDYDSEQVVKKKSISTRLLGSLFSARENRFIRPLNQAWLKNAICQICRTLDPRIDKSYSFDNLKIIYRQNEIFINNEDEWRVKCERALSSYSFA